MAQNGKSTQFKPFKPGTRFLIKLNALEIENGVMILGHRLEPFRNPEFPTSELSLQNGGKNKIAPRLVLMDLEDAHQFFSLYGVYLEARLVLEHPNNRAALISVVDSTIQAQPKAKIIPFPSREKPRRVMVYAVDLWALHSEGAPELEAGDYVLATQLDSRGTSFSLAALPAARIGPELALSWRNALAKAFKELLSQGEVFLDPVQLFRKAYGMVDSSVLEKPGGAFSEFFNTYDFRGLIIKNDARGWKETIAEDIFASPYQEFAEDFEDMDFEDEAEDEFAILAEIFDLSVDSLDLQIFFTDELAQYPIKYCYRKNTKLTKTALKKDRYLLQAYAGGQAIERTLVGLRLTGIKPSDRDDLQSSARDAIEQILKGFDPASVSIAGANRLRALAAALYERFLLWMRIYKSGPISQIGEGHRSLAGNLEKMIGLVEVCRVLNAPHLHDSDSAAARPFFSEKDLTEAGIAFVEEYSRILTSLESLIKPKDGHEEPRYSYVFMSSIPYKKPSTPKTISLPGNCTLKDLHPIIQESFGGDDSKPHRFIVDGMVFGPAQDWDPEKASGPGELVIPEDILSLDDFMLKVGEKVVYRYDFGDGRNVVARVTRRSRINGE